MDTLKNEKPLNEFKFYYLQTWSGLAKLKIFERASRL